MRRPGLECAPSGAVPSPVGGRPMNVSPPRCPPALLAPLLMLLASAALLMLGSSTRGQPAKIDVLRVAGTGTTTGNPDSPKEKVGMETLQIFIKEETGLNNEVLPPRKDWKELAKNLAQGRLHVAVFQGHEFAW